MDLLQNNIENGVIALESAVKEMTYQQKERYNALYHIYGEESEDIVRNIKGKTSLSWSFVYSNILKIFKAKNEEAAYYKAIKHTFDIELEYSEADISQMINEVRAEQGLDPYLNRIAAQCLEDFQTVFMAETVKDPKNSKRKSRVHKALHCLVK